MDGKLVIDFCKSSRLASVMAHPAAFDREYVSITSEMPLYLLC